MQSAPVAGKCVRDAMNAGPEPGELPGPGLGFLRLISQVRPASGRSFSAGESAAAAHCLVASLGSPRKRS
jgi:hypothetical protein